MIYIYSDGYQDQFGGENGKKYMAANFKKFLLKISKTMSEVHKAGYIHRDMKPDNFLIGRGKRTPYERQTGRRSAKAVI